MQDRRGDMLRLADMLESMRKIRTFTKAGREAFLASEISQDAVIRNLEVIGEAAGKVSQGIRQAHPNMPWAKMRGFASFAKHEYWRLDLYNVWAAVEGLPKLEAVAVKVRADFTRGGAGSK